MSHSWSNQIAPHVCQALSHEVHIHNPGLRGPIRVPSGEGVSSTIGDIVFRPPAAASSLASTNGEATDRQIWGHIKKRESETHPGLHAC